MESMRNLRSIELTLHPMQFLLWLIRWMEFNSCLSRSVGGFRLHVQNNIRFKYYSPASRACVERKLFMRVVAIFCGVRSCMWWRMSSLHVTRCDTTALDDWWLSSTSSEVHSYHTTEYRSIELINHAWRTFSRSINSDRRSSHRDSNP